MSPWISCRMFGLVALIVWSLALPAAAGDGRNPCPDCGNTSVPYPLSTSRDCGHPLYPILCTPQQTLKLQGTAFNYTITSIDAPSGTFIVAPAGFVGSSCLARDSTNPSGKYALNSSLPFFLTPNNTVFLLNASDMFLTSPLQCASAGPCAKALPVFSQVSCRGVLCCSYSVANMAVFMRGYLIDEQATARTGVYNLDINTDARNWKYGLQIGWKQPKEPPCTRQSDCGSNSTCSVSSLLGLGRFCLCNDGFEWDPRTGTCPRAPDCQAGNRSVRCNKTNYAIGLTLGLAGAIALSALTCFACKKHRAAEREHKRIVKERFAILAENCGGKSACLFSSRDMKRATNNFAPNMVLGHGGFGEVYKGILKDGTEVAIKSAKIGNAKSTDQVLNEVRVLSQVNHRNLVRLLGCCVESELPLLVYEYVPNGNLYDHIHGLKESLLDWKTRLRIALQAAEGLAYLHSSAYLPIYHRDVKSSNILLDRSMDAKVADFGLSRLAELDLTHVSTCAQGTLGYLDPEYYRYYQLTDKSDVYSFGVVLLELVTSKKAIDFARGEEDVNLKVMVQSTADQGKLEDVLDPRLMNGASAAAMSSMKCIIALALSCLNENRADRPGMKEVVDKLQQSLATIEASEDGTERKLSWKRNMSSGRQHHVQDVSTRMEFTPEEQSFKDAILLSAGR